MLFRVDLRDKYWQWGTLLFLSFIWGASFILLKKGLLAFDKYQTSALRLFFTFIILLPAAIKNIRCINRDTLLPLLEVGIIGTTIPVILFSTAQEHVDSSLAGMLNSLTPFFTLLLGVLLYRTKVIALNILGVLAGLLGALGLMIQDAQNIFHSINWNACLIVIATICYGINVNEIKNKLSTLSGLQIASLSLIFTGPLAGVYLIFTDYSNAINGNNFWLSIGSIFFLAFTSSVLAVVIFNNMLKYTTAIFASSVTYIMPVFAIFWGIFDNETISLIQFVWIGIIFLGVYLVNIQKKESLK